MPALNDSPTAIFFWWLLPAQWPLRSQHACPARPSLPPLHPLRIRFAPATGARAAAGGLVRLPHRIPPPPFTPASYPQLERARRLAAQYAAEALQSRPRLRLHLELDAPKVAGEMGARRCKRKGAGHVAWVGQRLYRCKSSTRAPPTLTRRLPKSHTTTPPPAPGGHPSGGCQRARHPGTRFWSIRHRVRCGLGRCRAPIEVQATHILPAWVGVWPSHCRWYPAHSTCVHLTPDCRH